MGVIVKGRVSINYFSPLNISGLQLWLDASDPTTIYQDSNATTITIADGDPVGCWKDKSGNAKNATQTDGTKKPARTNNIQNGNIGITYDGVNDYLQTGDLGLTVQPYSYYFVGKFLSLSGDRRQIAGLNETGNLDINPGINVYAGNAGMINIKTAPTNTFLARIEYNGASSLYQENNGTIYTGNAGTGVPNGIYLNTYLPYGLCGNVRQFELCIYNRLLSVSEIAKITNYLNSKWGVY